MRLQGCETRVSPSALVLCVRRGIREQQHNSHRYRGYGGVDGFDGDSNQSAAYWTAADRGDEGRSIVMVRHRVASVAQLYAQSKMKPRAWDGGRRM